MISWSYRHTRILYVIICGLRASCLCNFDSTAFDATDAAYLFQLHVFFKTLCFQSTEEWIRINNGTAVTIYQVAELFWRTYICQGCYSRVRSHSFPQRGSLLSQQKHLSNARICPTKQVLTRILHSWHQIKIVLEYWINLIQCLQQHRLRLLPSSRLQPFDFFKF
jgi:hypothetical protein